MLNNYRISTGKNLADLFINDQKNTLKLFKFYREEMSAHLNIEIEPIHISDEDNIRDNIVLLINKNDKFEIYPFEFNRNDDIELLFIKIMYLYKTIHEEEKNK